MLFAVDEAENPVIGKSQTHALRRYLITAMLPWQPSPRCYYY